MKFTVSILILLASFILSELYAQDKGESGIFTAAVVAGANLSQIDGDAAAGYNKIGLNIGGRGGIRVLKSYTAKKDPSNGLLIMLFLFIIVWIMLKFQ